MAVLSFFETGTGCELNPQLPLRVRRAYAELLDRDGLGSSARVVVSFLKRLDAGTINVTSFGLGLGVGCPPSYVREGTPVTGSDTYTLHQGKASCLWCCRPEDLPLAVRVNLLESVRNAPGKGGKVDKVRQILGLHPFQSCQSPLCG